MYTLRDKENFFIGLMMGVGISVVIGMLVYGVTNNNVIGNLVGGLTLFVWLPAVVIAHRFAIKRKNADVNARL